MGFLRRRFKFPLELDLGYRGNPSEARVAPRSQLDLSSMGRSLHAITCRCNDIHISNVGM